MVVNVDGKLDIANPLLPVCRGFHIHLCIMLFNSADAIAALIGNVIDRHAATLRPTRVTAAPAAYLWYQWWSSAFQLLSCDDPYQARRALVLPRLKGQ